MRFRTARPPLIHAAAEQAVIPPACRVAPGDASGSIERLGARVHLLVGNGPIERGAFGQIAPATAGARITVSVIAAATSDDSFPFPVRDESINPAAAAMLFSSSCASAAYSRISAAVMTG